MNRADAVCFLVEDGLGQAGTDAGSGCQVDHRVELSITEQTLHERSVSDVTLDQRVGFLAQEGFDVRPLQRRVVEIVEFIEVRHPVAPLQQAAG